MNTPPLLIIGAGGHARVLLDIILEHSMTMLGIVDVNPALIGQEIFGVPVIGQDDLVSGYSPDALRLVNAVGSVGSMLIRKGVYWKFKELGFSFQTIVHRSATIGKEVILAEGVQVMAGAIIQAGAQLGCNTLINTAATVDHDCRIGDHVHIAPGATLSGNIVVGDGTHIGTGANIIQGLKIGRDVIVGAGAVVVDNLPDGVTAVGVPARVSQR
ncbi:MAG: acetyltransferase [Desulfobulbaceae bacterium]|nr:acetyltransferase [Desulfobulbaceae bacterium]